MEIHETQFNGDFAFIQTSIIQFKTRKQINACKCISTHKCAMTIAEWSDCVNMKTV